MIALLSIGAHSDSIALKNGRLLYGKYFGGSSDTVGFVSGRNPEYFATSDILFVVFDSDQDSNLASCTALQCEAMWDCSVIPK